ncbi:hypothetical protein IMY05_C2442000900 [Salix suchowensis]|nr:hypothetical protein IMY05_C2442000900 [Salix suchowensis]
MHKSRPSEPTSPEHIGSPRVVDGVELEVEDGTLWGPYLSSTDSFDSLFDCISSDDPFESYFDGGADGGANADSESCQSDIDREQMNLDSDDAGSAIDVEKEGDEDRLQSQVKPYNLRLRQPPTVLNKGGEHTSDNEDCEGSEEGDFIMDNESASEDDTSDESQDEGSSVGQTCGKRRRRTTKDRFNRGPRRWHTIQIQPAHSSNFQRVTPLPPLASQMGTSAVLFAMTTAVNALCSRSLAYIIPSSLMLSSAKRTQEAV